MTTTDFFQELCRQFPEATDTLNDWDENGDLPYLRMSGLAAFTFKFFENDNTAMFRKIVDFVESKILVADEELYNMIGVNFVEDLVFDLAKSKRQILVDMLPSQMTYMYDSLKPIFEKKNQQLTRACRKWR